MRKKEIHAFKEGNWSEDRGSLERSWRRFARVVGAVPLGEDAASIPRRFWPDFTVKKPPVFATIAPRSGHGCAAIGPRSCVDRDPGAPSIIVGSSRIDSAAEGVRSWLDRTAIVGIFHAWSAPSNDAPAGWTIAIGLIPCAVIVRRIHRWPSDGAVMKPRWRSVVSGASTCHQVSLLITSLMPNF